MSGENGEAGRGLPVTDEPLDPDATHVRARRSAEAAAQSSAHEQAQQEPMQQQAQADPNWNQQQTPQWGPGGFSGQQTHPDQQQYGTPPQHAQNQQGWGQHDERQALQQQGQPSDQSGPKEIQTYPPIDELEAQIPISEATGQPRRDPQMLVAIGFLYASSVVAAVATGKAWWDMIHLHSFPTSIRIVEWMKPDSWSLTAVLLAVAMAASGAAMTAAPAIAGFNAWNGHRWSRIAAIVSVVISALAILLNDWAWAAIPLAAIGAGLLWLPAVGRYFAHWTTFRADQHPFPRDLSRVHYGPEPRYL